MRFRALLREAHVDVRSGDVYDLADPELGVEHAASDFAVEVQQAGRAAAGAAFRAVRGRSCELRKKLRRRRRSFASGRHHVFETGRWEAARVRLAVVAMTAVLLDRLVEVFVSLLLSAAPEALNESGPVVGPSPI